MDKYLKLLENLKELEAERTRISSEGDVLFDCWLAVSKPGGTAKTTNTHWQLRSRKAQFNGKKSRYIKAAEVGQFELAISRGKQLKQLDQRMEALRQIIIKIEKLIVA